MAAGPWTIYNEAKLSLGKKVFDLSADTFKIALFTSTSNAGSASLVTAQYATLTNEVAAANGYSTGGVTPGSVTWTASGGTMTFDTGDASWTASGGSITARCAVLYDITASNKDLVAYMLLDSTPADVTISSGNTLTIQIANVFTLS